MIEILQKNAWIVSLMSALAACAAIGVNIYLSRMQAVRTARMDNKKHQREIFFEFYSEVQRQQKIIDAMRFEWDLGSLPCFDNQQPNFEKLKIISEVYLNEFEVIIKELILLLKNTNTALDNSWNIYRKAGLEHVNPIPPNGASEFPEDSKEYQTLEKHKKIHIQTSAVVGAKKEEFLSKNKDLLELVKSKISTYNNISI